MKKLLIIFALLSLTALKAFAQPSITSVSPTENAIDVEIHTNIVITFSESIDGATINANTIIIQGSQTGLIGGTISGGGTNTITFDPYTDFKAGETITVTVTTGVKNTFGTPMTTPYFFSYTTSVASAIQDPPAFFTETVSVTSDGASSVYAADIDSDGDMDILSSSRRDNTIAWYENDGSGGFTSHTITTTAYGAESVYAADMDGDGDIDILSALMNNQTIAWYENDGSGGFTFRTITTTANFPVSVYAADVDGDGDMDVLSASQGNDTIAWHENNGSQGFTTRTITTTANVVGSVYATDVDGDGDMDVLSASYGDDTIAWYENNGSQGFTTRTITTTADMATSVYAADMDGDGDMDVLSSSRGDNTIAWYENDGNRGFTTHKITTTAGNATSVYAADVDGDGDMDALSAFGSTIAWYENDGNGGFTTHKITNSAVSAISVYAADVDGDGDMDVLSASYGDDTIAWYENEFSEIYNVTTTAINAFSVYAADVDSDGDMDMISASRGNKTIHWYESDGNRSFTTHTITTTATGVRTVHAADLDSDGDMDVLSANFGDDTIAWYENDGSQNFTTRTITTTADGVFSIHVADVDGDGDMDVLSASFFDDTIAWYENNGSQGFTAHTITNTADMAISVYAADMDGDGDMDVLSASRNDDTVAWYENNGSQGFTAHTITNTADVANYVYAADVDGDGDMDVLSASMDDNTIAWYENDGSQGFTTHKITTTAVGAFSVYAADVDGDGDMDVLSASYLDDTIAWYENNGSQDFTTHTITTTAYDARSVYAADLDGDGDMDILFASSGDDTIAWYENTFGEPLAAGKSLSFDGMDDMATLNLESGLPLYRSGGYTFEAWVKAPSQPDGVLYSETFTGGNAAFNLSADGEKLNISLINDASVTILNQTSQQSVFDSNWHHIVLSDNNGIVTLLIDGKTDSADFSYTPTGTVSLNKITIGSAKGAGFFEGYLDELRLWDGLRNNEPQLQNIFQKLGGNETGLAAYFPFDENGGGTALDKTANGNNGTLNAGVTRSEETHPYGTFITGSEGWRMMSSPFGDASYGQLLDGLWTQGFPGSDSPDFGNPNVLAFDEATSQFQSISDATDIPVAGEGFIVYVYDDTDYDGTPDGFPKTVQIDNTQTSGEITPTLSFTDSGELDDDGWNLVGNPYGATIDWDAASGWTRINIDDAIYIWNDAAGEYQSWNGVAGTLPNNGLIAPWQGYWVKANTDNPSLAKTDDVRAAGASFLKDNPTPVLELQLTTGELSSKTVLMLSENADLGKDPLDTYKLASLNGEFVSLFTSTSDGAAFDINALPLELESVVDVPLTMDGNDLSGEFELDWQVNTFPNGWKVQLIDHQNDQVVELTENGNYTFTMDGVQAKATSDQNHELESPVHGPIKPQVLKAKSSGSERFTIRITPGNLLPEEQEIPSQLALQQNYPNPFNPSTVISYQLPQTGNVRLEVYDMIGRRVATLVNSQVQAGVHEVNFNASNLSSGIYIYRLQTANQTITKKLTLIK